MVGQTREVEGRRKSGELFPLELRVSRISAGGKYLFVGLMRDITERKAMDAVLRGRDEGLFSAVTDCGAGGLSSAVGEMAEGLGATVQLERVPLKYEGLAPWEIWISDNAGADVGVLNEWCVQVIGATTLDEYRKHIESDSALERRFQPVQVEEPDVEETIEILRGIRSAYEEHHRLSISDDALDAAAQLSSRYVTDRFLPDKAIDLIDESSSRVRMYKSPAAKTAKELIGQIKEIRANHGLALEDGRYEEAQEILERQEALESQLDRLQNVWDRSSSPIVTAEDIAEVVSMWTGVPVMQIAQEESIRLLQMEEELRAHIVGQEEDDVRRLPAGGPGAGESSQRRRAGGGQYARRAGGVRRILYVLGAVASISARGPAVVIVACNRCRLAGRRIGDTGRDGRRCAPRSRLRRTARSR